MFDSLSDRIREDEHKEVSTAQRTTQWLAMILLAVLVFGGLYYAVRMLQ